MIIAKSSQTLFVFEPKFISFCFTNKVKILKRMHIYTFQKPFQPHTQLTDPNFENKNKVTEASQKLGINLKEKVK